MRENAPGALVMGEINTTRIGPHPAPSKCHTGYRSTMIINIKRNFILIPVVYTFDIRNSASHGRV